MSIIFLDFDGVLHPQAENSPEFFTKKHFLWRLLRDAPKALVVFSTSWRYGRTTQELAKLVSSGGGEDLSERFIGSTPILQNITDEYGHRELECIEWLAKNCPGEPWIAIDDQAAWFRSFERLVIVRSNLGLTDEDVSEALIKLHEFCDL